MGLWIIDGIGSILLEVLGDGFDEVDQEDASFDLPTFLLGNFADARPAILSGTEKELKAVDVGSLVSTLLLGSLVT